MTVPKTDTSAFVAACKWALEKGWLERDLPYAAGEGFYLTLTPSQIDVVIAIAEEKLAFEIPQDVKT